MISITGVVRTNVKNVDCLCQENDTKLNIKFSTHILKNLVFLKLT
jgi:hypothetical protein